MSTAIVEVVDTDRARDPPSRAYTAIGTMQWYSPTSVGRLAMAAGHRLGDDHRTGRQPGDDILVARPGRSRAATGHCRRALRHVDRSWYTVDQSSLMLTTVQSSSLARRNAVSAPLSVVELPLGVVVQHEEAQRRVGPAGEAEHRDVAIELLPRPAAGASTRLQIRTGFTGPSSKTSGSAR